MALPPFGAPKFQAFDGNGDPLVGGLLYSYEAGTDTPKATYTSHTGLVANANPVVLDARGEASVYLNGTYKLVLKTAAEATIWTVDNVQQTPDQTPAFITYDGTPTRTGNTTFTVTGDQTATFFVGVRLKLTDSTVLYGTVTNSSYSDPTTTVTVSLDSGNLSASLSAVAIGTADANKHIDASKVAYGTSDVDTKLDSLQTEVDAVETQIAQQVVPRNLLDNPDFTIAQRGTSYTAATTPANNDATKIFDRWNLWSDGDDVVDLTQETSTVPSNATNALKIDVETANLKFAVGQLIHKEDMFMLIGGKVSLSFQARKGSSNVDVDTIKVGIFRVDEAFKKPVNTANWGTTGTNPTWQATWSLLGSQEFSLSNSYQTFELENVELTGTDYTGGLAVVFFYNYLDADVGDLIYLSRVVLVPGESAVGADYRSAGDILTGCKRRFQKSYSHGTKPSSTTTVGAYYFWANSTAANQAGVTVHYSPSMALLDGNMPTVTLYSPVSGTAGVADRGGTEIDVSGASASEHGFTVLNTEVTTDNAVHSVHWTADSEAPLSS